MKLTKTQLRELIKEEIQKLNEGSPIVEVQSNIKVRKSDTIDGKTWIQMKYDLRDQFDELVDIGEDYGVFQDAKDTHKMLKQIKKIMDRI